MKQLCEPYSELLIRSMAQQYYYEDDFMKMLVGKIMRESRGKANPAIVEKIIKHTKAKQNQIH